MLTFFKKQKVNAHSVTIPELGWTKVKDSDSLVQWVNPEQTMGIYINFFDVQPNIPTMKDVDALRDLYRKNVVTVNGGLIEGEIVTIHSIPTAKIILKIPQNPSGMTYLGSLTIPFENCSFVLKIQANEVGITGMRDALITDRLIRNGELKITSNGMGNWFSDPYDVNFKGGILMNKAEQEIYDPEFLDHPLTQVRKIMKQIQEEVNFKPEMEKLEAFTK
jgi:hypothetical protein